jgi:hypothetical protein
MIELVSSEQFKAFFLLTDYSRTDIQFPIKSYL